MSEWITDRRPSWEDDLVSGLVFVSLPEVNRVITKSAVDVVLGEPWQRIPTPEPYVKPKTWTSRWNVVGGCWLLENKRKEWVHLGHLTQDQAEAAQQIEDIYNKVKPKRWTVEWNEFHPRRCMKSYGILEHYLPYEIMSDEAAQQIEDIYNKVMP
jgi:hypothetical protein